jgi:hypothetical protein
MPTLTQMLCTTTSSKENRFGGPRHRKSSMRFVVLAKVCCVPHARPNFRPHTQHYSGIKIFDADKEAQIWTLTSARGVSRRSAGRNTQRENGREVHKRLREEADARHRGPRDTELKRVRRLVFFLIFINACTLYMCTFVHMLGIW